MVAVVGDAPVAPFRAAPYILPGGLTLSTMSPDEAAHFGTLCAAIDPWLGYPSSAAQLSALFALKDPAAPRFTARLGGVLAATLAVRLDWMRGPYIHMLAVAPPFQGRGIGSHLLTWIEDQARAAGDRNLWIAVTDFNTGAHRLYARHGFSEAARLDALVTEGRAEILMRKRLFPAA